MVFATDKAEDEQQISERAEKAAKALGIEVKKSGLESVQERFEELIEPHVITRLKIALVGEGGTGKTTTLHLLLGDTPPLQYVPTIALNLETVENIRFGNYSLVLWDFAGQERFRTLWRFYFHGADVIILVCDSTLRNVLISKDILKLIKRDAPKVPIIALANKQDKPNAMKPEVVQKILGVPTYPMVAIDKSRRDEMLRILMTAAAQYVGVALPDLPVSELLRFTKVTEEKEAEEEEVEEEEEEEYEVVEEIIYVDEEGHPIKDLDEYEIIEEEVIEVEDDELPPEEVSTSISPEVKAEVEAESMQRAETSQSEEPFEIAVETTAESTMDETVHVEVSEEVEEPKVVSPSMPVEEPVGLIEIHEPEEFEVSVEGISSKEGELPVEIESTVAVAKPAEAEISEDMDTQLVIDLITEALDADDIVAAEIEQTSHEDLTDALEAFSSDEVIAMNDEEVSAIDDETIAELDKILGTLGKDIPAVVETSEDEDSEESITLDEQSIRELDELYEGKKKEQDD